MGELKRAQELRVDEFSVQKMTESRDTTQRLTSQIQKLQEWMSCMNDIAAFQDIESNYSGKLTHVPSQPAGIPCPRSMPSRDRSMPTDTWNFSETQGNVFVNPRPMFDSSQTPYQGILHSTNPSATGAVPVQGSTETPIARGEERIGSTTSMPMSARRPSTMNPFSPAEVPQNSMAVQQRIQISELHCEKYPTPSTFSCWKIKFSTPSTFSCWKIRFKPQVSSYSDFPYGSDVMDQRNGDGRFSG